MLDFTFASSSELCLEFAKRVRAQRLRLNMSQPELAMRAGLALGTISGFEKSGKTTLDSFFRILRVLGLVQEMDALFLQQPSSIQELEAATKPPRQRVSSHRKASP